LPIWQGKNPVDHVLAMHTLNGFRKNNSNGILEFQYRWKPT
jgi:hypothetical protein